MANNQTNNMTFEKPAEENIKQLKNKEKNNNSDRNADFDDLLTSAGELGLYQVLLFLATMPFYFFGVFSYYSQIFMTEIPSNHWCRVPELENITLTEKLSLSIPEDPKSPLGYSRCLQYVANWSEITVNNRRPDPTWKAVPCQHGWEFDTSEIPYPTVGMEMEWVCDKDSYQASAQSIFFCGSILGGFLIGWIADRFGRIPAVVASNLFGCIGGVASTFAQNFTQFSICRFIMGISYDNCMMMIYLLALEYIAPKHRTMIANMGFALPYTIGSVALPWISLACGHWKIIGLATSIPMGISILTPLVIPESPRWLLSKQRIEDAIEKVLTISRVNKKAIPPKAIVNFRTTSSKKKEEKVSVMEVIRRPIMRKMLICICTNFMCCMIVFDVLVRSIGQFNFNFFVSFTIISITEFPSLLLMSLILDIVGRKLLISITLVIACIFSIATAFVANGLPSLICATIARFVVNMACNISMQWVVEMFPTPVRGSATSAVHICSYISVIISPFIVYLEKFAYWLPLALVGLLAVVGAAVALPLPETAGKDMPHTFEDAEDMVREQKLWEVPFMKKSNQGKV